MKKKIMWICSVIGAGAVMSLVFGAISQRKEPEIIAVNGECNASTPKDKTAITMRVTVVAPTAVESMKAATNQVKEITDTEVVLDFNHPLAGKTLTFDVEIKEIN